MSPSYPGAFERLEPLAFNGARAVLRRGGDGNIASLSDPFPSRKLIHYEEEKMKNQQQELDKQLPNDVSQFGAPLAEIEWIFHEEEGLQK